MQKKDYLTNLMNFIYERSLADIKCAYIAKIVRMTKPTATVQPLAMLNGKKQPEVENVFFAIPQSNRPIKLNYHAGDNVLVDVLDHDDQYFKNNNNFRVTSNRKHAIDYSVIVGKIAKSSDFA